MKIREITEEFAEGKKSSITNRYYEIYKNPDMKDLMDIKKQSSLSDVRIIIDKKNKDLYVFPAELLHKDALKALDLPADEHLIKTSVPHRGKGVLGMNTYLASERRRKENRGLLKLFGRYFQ